MSGAVFGFVGVLPAVQVSTEAGLPGDLLQESGFLHFGHDRLAAFAAELLTSDRVGGLTVLACV